MAEMTKADKGGAVVIINVKEYTREVEAQSKKKDLYV